MLYKELQPGFRRRVGLARNLIYRLVFADSARFENPPGRRFHGNGSIEHLLIEGFAESLDLGVRVDRLAEAVFDRGPEPVEVLLFAAGGEGAVGGHLGMTLLD